MLIFRIKILFLTVFLFASPSHAQSISSKSVDILTSYSVIPDVTYLTADGVDLKLDIYKRKAKGKVPTVIFIHGGGWVGGDKDAHNLSILPYLSKGYAAVNVEYRLGGTALAPAAVEDTRCAVWWVKRNAEKYGFDPDRIILTGNSAGGHLSLITGMLPASEGLDGRCPQRPGGPMPTRATASLPHLEVAAIINWSGITDVNDLISGDNMRTYSLKWMGAMTDREAIAKRVSPLSYIREGLPPILTLHGDRDVVVPYDHAVRLHKALDEKGQPNQLHTIKGREHFSDYTPQDMQQAFKVIDAFLAKYITP